MVQQEQLEHLRFMVLYKSNTLDRESQPEITAFNKLLSAYQELYDPQILEERTVLKDNFDDMKDVFSQGFMTAKLEKTDDQ